jgi:hypothetical protein
MKNSTQPQATEGHNRVVIWIDHMVAKIFQMGLAGVNSGAVHAHPASTHLHHKANTVGSGRAHDDPVFLPQIAKAIETCHELLIMGPGIEKAALLHHLQSVRSDLAIRVETSDHPTDAQIIAHGRKHFRLD